MTNRHYILKDRKITPVEDPMEWAVWFEKGETWISTVFLGIDHNYGDGPPVLWETMAFKKTNTAPDKRREVDCDRCSGNWEQAEAMHQRMVSKWEIEV